MAAISLPIRERMILNYQKSMISEKMIQLTVCFRLASIEGKIKPTEVGLIYHYTELLFT